MAQRLILNSTEPVPFDLASAADHRTPMLGRTPAVVLSKAAGLFGPPAGTVAEVGNGRYEFRPNPGDTDTVGPLVVHATAPGCDAQDVRADVVAHESDEILPAGSTAYPLLFLLVDAADHVSGVPGKLGGLAVTLRQPGGTYVAPAAGSRLVEVGYGLYALWPTATDTAVPGPLLLHATAPGCDAADETYDVGPIAVPPGAPADLIDAVVAHLLADPTVTADVGGRVWQGRAGHDEELPYVLITDPMDDVWTSNTKGSGYDGGTLQFDVYVEDPGDGSFNPDDRANSIGWDVAGTLTGASLTFARGKLRYLRRIGQPRRMGSDPDPGPHGLPVWRSMLIMRYTVSRSA